MNLSIKGLQVEGLGLYFLFDKDNPCRPHVNLLHVIRKGGGVQSSLPDFQALLGPPSNLLVLVFLSSQLNNHPHVTY